MPANPPTLTPDQLERYLERIKYAEEVSTINATHKNPRSEPLRNSKAQKPERTLLELQVRHLGSIPWGNSALHYSTHHSISIHPAAIFDKLVVGRRDGYCMENTYLLYMVLCSLGYQVYPTGGRVHRAIVTGYPADEGYISFSHMVLIVNIAELKFMVDVGFGRNSPLFPLPLEEDMPASPFLGRSEVSLTKGALPEFTDKQQKVWIYQIRDDPDSPWIPQYAFSEVEFTFEDFSMMNFFTSQSRSMLFTQKLAVTRVILDEEGEGQVKEPESGSGSAGRQVPQTIGIYVLAGREVKRILEEGTETVEVFNVEEDRVRALGKYFGMRFQDHEVEGIRGLSSEIKPIQL